MIYMTICRGLPGSGKTTIAKQLLYHARVAGRKCNHYEADMYFMRDGVYQFDMNNLADAHDWCRSSVEDCMQEGCDAIVSNTFTTIRELRPYFEIAKEFGVVPNVILCQSNFGSVHNVPPETLEKMRKRFVYDLSPLFGEFKV